MPKKRSKGAPAGNKQWQRFKDDLRACITAVEFSGTFATSDSIDNFVNPGISIDPIGLIRLPLSEEDAKAIAHASHKAPFGKDQRTLVDKSVRMTWEIQASEVRILNPEWRSCVDRIAARVADELGVGRTGVHAELHKMLLYEQGGMFKRHQDTEKVAGMFGTLVICLPSQHTGGAVRLQLGNDSIHMQTEKNSAFNATFLAWYADVQHEIEPVLSGYRWVLTYNLVNTSKFTISSPFELHAQTERLVRILSPWSTLQTTGQYLIYPLEHQYSERNLNLAKLKGRDRVRVRYVADACSTQGGFYVLLAHLEMVSTDDYKNNSRLWLKNIVHPNGVALPLMDRFEVPYNSLLVGSDYYNRKPGSQTEGGYPGNEHVEIEQVFRNSLRLSHLQSWVAKLDREMTEEPFDMKAHEILLQTCRNTISSQYNSDSERRECFALIAEAAILLQDLALFKDAVQAPKMYFKRSFYQMLGRSIHLQDPWVDENDIARCLHNTGDLAHVCDNLDAFCRSFCSSNTSRNDATKKGYTIDWVGRQFLELLASAPDVKECAIASLIRFLNGWGIEVPRNHNETVRKALRSLVHDATQQGNFARTLALHLSYELQHFEESDDFLGDIFRHLLEVVAEPAASAFNLKWYASDVFGYRKRSQRNGPSSAVGSLGHFYQHLSTFNERACATLAERIQTQARSLDNQQLQSILYPLLREMLEHLDESAEASRLIQWLTERYVTQTVGLEPDRNISHGAAPSDWACPQEALTGCKVGGCRACAKLHAFLRDPHERTLSCDANNNYEIFKSPNHIGYRFRRDDSQTKYFDIEWGEVEITFTKVDELLDSEHQTWEKRCNNMTSTLKKLPEKKWRAFLAHRYDELINVEIVKTRLVATKPAAPVELPGASESSATSTIRSKLPRRTKGAQG